jgi:hypothetical protein
VTSSIRYSTVHVKQDSKFVKGTVSMAFLIYKVLKKRCLGQARRKRIDRETDGRLNPKSMSIAVPPDISMAIIRNASERRRLNVSYCTCEVLKNEASNRQVRRYMDLANSDFKKCA